MILGTYGSNIDTYLSLEEKRINTSVVENKVRYLFKFINDMTGAVKYAYGTKGTTNERYVKNTFAHNTSENIFTGNINFKPYWFWKYEVYEVTWNGSVAVNDTNAPNSETETLTVNDNNGVVRGKVEEGKLYIQETSGQEQVKYTKYEPSSSTNYLYTN